jgi:hypothetical protein
MVDADAVAVLKGHPPNVWEKYSLKRDVIPPPKITLFE